MAYKILLLRRGGSSPLWEPYIIEKKIMEDDPSGAVDSDGNPVKIEKIVQDEFETAELNQLDLEVEKLLETRSKREIWPINDLSFTIDALIEESVPGI